MDWIFALGIGFISAFFAIVIVFFIKGIKGGFLTTLINFGTSVVSFVISFFLAKPALWLFDKIFNFSTSYFDKFATAFAKIPLMNEFVNTTNYATQVSKFETEPIVLSSWLKRFLLKIFQNTSIYPGQTTTLGTIGANALSYILMVVLVMITLFTVIKIVSSKLITKYVKINPTNKFTSKFGGWFLGLLNGLVYVVLGMMAISLVPTGADSTIIADSIEKTYVLRTPFQIAQTITIDYFSTSIDWTTRNDGFATIDESLIATYVNKNDNLAYLVTVTVEVDNNVTERIYDVENNSTTTLQYKYVYANGKIWLYDSSNQFYASRRLSKRYKTMIYKTQFEKDNQKIKYNQPLVQQ